MMMSRPTTVLVADAINAEAAIRDSAVIGGRLPVMIMAPTTATVVMTLDALVTVDRAITMLRTEGVIRTAGRGGTVVGGGSTSATVTVAVQEPPGVTIVSAEVKRASAEVAGELGVRPGSAVIVVRLKGEPT
jgi:hypothetical protein